MLGVLKRRERSLPAKPTAAEPAKCGLLACPHCGLAFETLTLRCPRCRADIPLGCGGNCSTCGKA
jgi:hypothetical protein